ncbi:MAG: sporulation phosphorelay system protein KapB [Paenibacillaceae bacterium]
MSEKMKTGALCLIDYKSGRYIAEFVERSQNNRTKAVVKILSVVDHPQQGDLHHPYQVDVPLFHQRKASAYLEHVLLPMNMIEIYTDEVVDYQSSLAYALQRQLQELAEKDDEWSKKAREQLLLLKEDYGY